MSKIYKQVWLLAGISILLAIVIGIILPPLISTNALSATSIVLLLGVITAIVLCLLLLTVNLLRKE